jgi:hypothetical protein
MDALNRDAAVKNVNYTDECIEAETVLPKAELGRYKEFIPNYSQPKEDWDK